MLAFVTIAKGQEILGVKLNTSTKNMLLEDVFLQLEEKEDVRFYFNPQWIKDLKVDKEFSGQTINELLTETFEGSQITFVVMYDYAIILVEDPQQKILSDDILNQLSAENKEIIDIQLGERPQGSLPKGKAVITGVITDEKENTPIAGATITALDINVSTVTTPDGRYRIELPVGIHILEIRSLSYDTKVLKASVQGNAMYNAQMLEEAKVLEELVVTDNIDQQSVQKGLGVVNIKMEDLKKLPAFLGEVDIIKQIQTLPGVTSVGDVSSGFNVRGGGADQNLVLYDRVPVFNTSHVFGFFSAFNADAIRDAQFYKAGIPTEYGGRVSSVLALTSKDGNTKKWGVSGGLGLISSNISVQGPIVKEKTSVIASVRTSYSDWMINAFAKDFPDVKNSSVSFYDATLKLSQKVGQTGKLSLSGYVSKDKFGLPSDTTFKWNNLLTALTYDQSLSQNLLFNATLGYGQYGYEVSDSDPANAYAMAYKIKYPNLNLDVLWQRGKIKANGGLQNTYYSVSPTSLSKGSDASAVVPFSRDKEQYFETAAYLNSTIEVNSVLSFTAGFRLSRFTSLGKATVFRYDQDENSGVITDTVQYGANEAIKSYFGPEPRAAFKILITPTLSVKGGYDRIYQYLHLISNSVAVSPIDVWQPSNYHFKPQKGDQISLGVFKTLKENQFETSLEVYQKHIEDVLDFKEGAELVLNRTLEQSLLRGTARGYGAELSFNKLKGRLVWNLNYTYARTFRKIKGINDGKEYPSSYDQPHIVNFNWKYGLSKRFSFTGNFSYRSGRPITVPYSYTVIDNVPIVNYSERNSFRIADYHRLDLALVVEGSHKKDKFWDGTWVFSLYNVYGRNNVYSVFYRENGNGLKQAYSMSIVGSVLPSISYQFKI